MDLQDKIAIVTGASSGIGEATAHLFSQEGAKVALVARSKDKLEKLAKELPNSLAIPTDMTKEKDIKEMIAKVIQYFGRIDIVINNAGRGYDASLENTNIDTLHTIFDLDFVGPIIAMQQAIPIMRKQGQGKIVNISSGTALMTFPNMGGYAAIKQALAKISLTAREELKKDNIAVCVVYPYITDTRFEENTIKDMPEVEHQEEGRFTPPPADSAEFVAEKILEAVQTNEAEIIVHDWMKNQYK